MVALHKLTTEKPSHPWYPSHVYHGTDYRQVFSGAPLRALKKDCIQKADQPCPELLTKHQGTGH